MPTEQFENLLSKMPAISKAVNAFTSDMVQKEAFHALIEAFYSKAKPPKVENEKPGGETNKKTKKKAKKKVAKKKVVKKKVVKKKAKKKKKKKYEKNCKRNRASEKSSALFLFYTFGNSFSASSIFSLGYS